MTGLPCTFTILMFLKESAKHTHAHEESDLSAKHCHSLHQIAPEQSSEGTTPYLRDVAYSKGWQNQNNQRNNCLPKFTLTELQSWQWVFQSHKTTFFAVECCGALIQRYLSQPVPSVQHIVAPLEEQRNSTRSSFRCACLRDPLAASLIKVKEYVLEAHKNYKQTTSFLQLMYQGVHVIWEIICTVTVMCSSH